MWAVVKADAYGHGAVQVGRAALDAGATKLCVATWEEARSLREGLPDAAVLVMSPLAPGEEDEVRDVEVTRAPGRRTPACELPERRWMSTSRWTPAWAGGG